MSSGSRPQRRRLDQPHLSQRAPFPDGMGRRSISHGIPGGLRTVSQVWRSHKHNLWHSSTIFQVDMLKGDRDSTLRITLRSIARMIRVVGVGIYRLVTLFLFLMLMAATRRRRFRALLRADCADDCRRSFCRCAFMSVMPAAPQHAVEQHGDEGNPTDNLANHVTRFGDVE